MTIYFYLPRDEWGFLSNFSPHGVALDGTYWPTVEHFFQAAKFTETDPAHAVRIQRAHKPKDAARLGRDRGHPLRCDWEEVKDDVMRRGVRCKFETHDELRRALLDTGDAELVEASPTDFYWGCGNDGSGLNRLGLILMEVRAALRATPAVESPVDPSDGRLTPKGRRH
ncbi:NADAR domain-containing protein [Chondromyces crocatus]|uniref:NADAR domain-containing protein n=1 Tax=Chondromyces crocatus TaxID=52 RepID=UPI00067D1841